MPACKMKSGKRGGSGGKISSAFNGNADPYYADPTSVSVPSPAPATGGFFGGGGKF